MSINKNNYEVWFLDYFEQQLSAEQVAELFLFLEQHPALKEEFNAFENSISIPLGLEQERMPQKQSLKKFNAVSAENIHEWLIADLQGDLNLQQSAALRTFLEAHPSYQIEKALYKKTILNSKNEETFPNKKKLKKGVVLPFYQRPSFYRIAAVLLLFIGGTLLFSIYNRNNEVDRQMVEINDTLSVPQNTERIAPASNEEKKYASIDTNIQQVIPSKEKTLLAPKIAPTPASGNKYYAKKETVPARSKKSFAPVTLLVHTIHEVDTFTVMELRDEAYVPVKEKLLTPERRYTPKATPAYNIEQEPPSLFQVLQASKVATDVIDVTANGINKAIGEELVSSPENTLPLPFKSRLLRFAANSISKVSRNKVKVRTSFNPITGKLSAYEIETRKKTIQKQYEAGKFYTENK